MPIPDRIAQRRAEGGGRYLLAQGRGVRLPQGSILGANPFLVAVHLDSGEKAEGTIHMAEPVSEETIREEMGVPYRDHKAGGMGPAGRTDSLHSSPNGWGR